MTILANSIWLNKIIYFEKRFENTSFAETITNRQIYTVAANDDGHIDAAPANDNGHADVMQLSCFVMLFYNLYHHNRNAMRTVFTH